MNFWTLISTKYLCSLSKIPDGFTRNRFSSCKLHLSAPKKNWNRGFSALAKHEKKEKKIRGDEANREKENYGNFLPSSERMLFTYLLCMVPHEWCLHFSYKILFLWNWRKWKCAKKKTNLSLNVKEMKERKKKERHRHHRQQKSDVLMPRIRYWFELFLLFIGHCKDLSVLHTSSNRNADFFLFPIQCV